MVLEMHMRSHCKGPKGRVVCRRLPLVSYIVCANSEGSGKTRYAGSLEPTLFAYVISTLFTWVGSFEPPHDKTNTMICAPSDDSDQPGQLPSLIRVFAVGSMGKDPSFPHVDSEDSDQTGQMPRLILFFAHAILLVLS